MPMAKDQAKPVKKKRVTLKEWKSWTLQERLAHRKYKPTNRFFYFIYYFIMTKLVAPKYKPEYTITDDINKEKGPAFVIWNHLSRLDHAYVMKVCYPRRINIVAGYNEFFRSHLHFVFKLNNCLPKKNFTQDIGGIRAINSIVQQGGTVAFSPEGMSSIFGNNQPIVNGTGSFLKHYRIPVYNVTMRGQFLTNTKHCLDERAGRTTAELKLLYSPEDLDQKTGEEIDAELNALFRHDDYAWGKEQHIKWKTNGRICEHLNDSCFRCPRCGADLTMDASGDDIHCTACGNGAKMNDYYEFEPYDDSCVIPESPVKWTEWEREQIIREIRADEAYSYSEHAVLGYIPKDHWIPKKQSSENCGDGIVTFDHSGMHYVGTKLGEPFEFSLNYEQLHTLVIVNDITQFAVYYKGEYLEFKPEKPCVGKMLIVCEEMHRLHVNSWKNFPWYDYMYPELSQSAENTAD